jgi:arginine utilization protein RocB
MTHEFIAPTYSYTHDTVSFRNSQNQPINGEIDQVNFWSVEGVKYTFENNANGNNRYASNSTVNDSCSDLDQKQQNLPMHQQSASTSMARLVWRFKKRAAAAIYEKYRFDIQQAFDKWREVNDRKQQDHLRNLVLEKLILDKNKRVLKTSLTKLKHSTRSDKVTEGVKITLMNRWRKRFVFKVFKIIRKQAKNEPKTHRTTKSIRHIKHLQI